MNRLEQLRKTVNDILRQQESPWGYVHLYGVSATCVLLAVKRGLDPELAGVVGMLHDITTYKTGDRTDHAPRGAVEAQGILERLGSFTRDEITLISDAISRHAAKDAVDGDMAELLKDADVLQPYLYNPGIESRFPERLKNILAELDLP
jgi:HD superfamily phosphodiesterase